MGYSQWHTVSQTLWHCIFFFPLNKTSWWFYTFHKYILQSRNRYNLYQQTKVISRHLWLSRLRHFNQGKEGNLTGRSFSCELTLHYPITCITQTRHNSTLWSLSNSREHGDGAGWHANCKPNARNNPDGCLAFWVFHRKKHLGGLSHLLMKRQEAQHGLLLFHEKTKSTKPEISLGKSHSIFVFFFTCVHLHRVSLSINKETYAFLKHFADETAVLKW